MVLVYDPTLGRLIESDELFRITSGSVLGVTEESQQLGIRSRDIDPESLVFRQMQQEGLPIYQTQFNVLAYLAEQGDTRVTQAVEFPSAGDDANVAPIPSQQDTSFQNPIVQAQMQGGAATGSGSLLLIAGLLLLASR